MTLEMIVERMDDAFWGRVNYEDNLIVTDAESIEALKADMIGLLKDFHEVEGVAFTISYDLTALFEEFNFLNLSAVARRANISPSLFRQYVSGQKHPSEDRAKQIEETLHGLGLQLAGVSVIANASA